MEPSTGKTAPSKARKAGGYQWHGYISDGLAAERRARENLDTIRRLGVNGPVSERLLGVVLELATLRDALMSLSQIGGIQ
jgi:hypothetical protein